MEPRAATGAHAPPVDIELRAIEAVVPYLRATVLDDPRTGDDDVAWHDCDALLRDPLALRPLVDATAAGRGSDQAQVLASLFAQSYAFRVASVAVAGWVLGRPVVSPAPEHTAIAVTRSRPGRLGLRIADAADPTEPADPATPVLLTGSDELVLPVLVDRLVVRHLGGVIGALRATTTIGARLLWGDVVASIVAVMRAVEGEVAPDRKPIVRARGEELLRAADAAVEGGLADLGAFVVLHAHDDEGWFWERTSCCLWYRSTEAERAAERTGSPYCGDCSLVATDDRRAAFVAGLGASGARS